MDLGGGLRIESIRQIWAFGGEDEGTQRALQFAYESLPPPLATHDAPLASACAGWSEAPGDGVDRISSLPDEILRDIVSRLPVKDAARTGVLAPRWRGLWRSAPLVFVDTHLVPGCRASPLWRPGLEDTLRVINDVSSVLAAHPGPFRCVQISCCYSDLTREKVESWLQLVADKGVQELAFINRPWPLDIPLPTTLFSCTSLTRLHIGAWKFPNTAGLPRTAAFPHLKELFLSLINMKRRDLAFLLDRSPVLEVLTIIASQTDVRLCLVSRTLRCLQVGLSSLGDIDVADAPRLERLFVMMSQHSRTGRNKFPRITIGSTPNLQMLGCWPPGQQELQIGKTIIKAGTNVSASTIIPSVKILSLVVHFELFNEIKTVPSFLQCFPNVETLHVESCKVDKPTGNINLKFWKKACPVECVQHVKKLVIHGFQGKENEHAFIKFIGEKAQGLEKLVIMICPVSFSLQDDLDAKMRPFTTVKWANKDFKTIHFKFPHSRTTPWSFLTSADVSCRDPFDLASAV